MTPSIKKLTSENFITSNWSAGKTTELFIYPEGSNFTQRDFKVRISTATVEIAKSHFTSLPGFERYITPLDHNLKLTHDQINFIDLEPFEIYNFDGSQKTTSFNKVRDFNLMLGNGAQGKLESIPLNEIQKTIPITSSLNILYCYEGNMHISINNENLKLGSNELLVIWRNETNEIKIHSDIKSNLLSSSIDI